MCQGKPEVKIRKGKHPCFSQLDGQSKCNYSGRGADLTLGN